MNIRYLLTIFALVLPAAAETPAPDAPTPPKAAAAKWTMVGEWLGTHTTWTDKITIRPDGTFSRAAGDRGTWHVFVQDNHPVLQLDWEIWAPEKIDMITSDFFRGPTREGVLELRRVSGDAAVASAKPELGQAK
jgi:hypothetical protein